MHAQIPTTLVNKKKPKNAQMLTALSVLGMQVFYTSAVFSWPIFILVLPGMRTVQIQKANLVMVNVQVTEAAAVQVLQ